MTGTIGLLHPGAMGAVVGRTLVAGGHDVAWAAEGRSDASRARARDAGLREVGTLEALLAEAHAVVSVVPPHAAEKVLDAVLAQRFAGLYLDANAVAPARARFMAERVAAAGGRFVDGGILGRPPERRGTTWLYLAGREANAAATWFRAGPLEAEVVGTEPGAASALKMAFAAWSKGSTALLAAMLAYAEAAGVREALDADWERRRPGFMAEAEDRARAVTAKAWRFEGEMHEIADAFEAVGVPGGIHRTAAEIYRRLAPLGVRTDADLAAVVEAVRGRLEAQEPGDA